MASSKAPKHDFAPAWLKIPEHGNQVRTVSFTRKSEYTVIWITFIKVRNNFYVRLPYIRLFYLKLVKNYDPIWHINSWSECSLNQCFVWYDNAHLFLLNRRIRKDNLLDNRLFLWNIEWPSYLKMCIIRFFAPVGLTEFNGYFYSEVIRYPKYHLRKKVIVDITIFKGSFKPEPGINVKHIFINYLEGGEHIFAVETECTICHFIRDLKQVRIPHD